jgi:hypothetical protein
MSYKFGKSSRARLDTCDPKLQDILEEAIKYMDFTVLCGHRSKADQDAAVHEGRSKVSYPNSKHNSNPSKAVDVAPYPIDWNNTERFAMLQGLVKGIAMMKGIKIRSGIDWDGDGDITDHSFMDYPHFELDED